MRTVGVLILAVVAQGRRDDGIAGMPLLLIVLGVFLAASAVGNVVLWRLDAAADAASAQAQAEHAEQVDALQEELRAAGADVSTLEDALDVAQQEIDAVSTAFGDLEAIVDDPIGLVSDHIAEQDDADQVEAVAALIAALGGSCDRDSDGVPGCEYFPGGRAQPEPEPAPQPARTIPVYDGSEIAIWITEAERETMTEAGEIMCEPSDYEDPDSSDECWYSGY